MQEFKITNIYIYAYVYDIFYICIILLAKIYLHLRIGTIVFCIVAGCWAKGAQTWCWKKGGWGTDVDSPFVSNEGMFRNYRPKNPVEHIQIVTSPRFKVECTKPQLCWPVWPVWHLQRILPSRFLWNYPPYRNGHIVGKEAKLCDFGGIMNREGNTLRFYFKFSREGE